MNIVQLVIYFILKILICESSKTYYVALNTITYSNPKELSTIRLYPPKNYQASNDGFVINQVKRGTRYLMHEPYDGEITYMTLSAVGVWDIYFDLEGTDESFYDQTYSFRKEYLEISLKDFIFKLYVRECLTQNCREIINIHPSKINLLGYVWLNQKANSHLKMTFKIDNYDLYLINLRNNDKRLLPIYSDIKNTNLYIENAKIIFNNDEHSINLQNSILRHQNNLYEYGWIPISVNENSPNKRLKVVYFHKLNDKYKKSILIVSFCFRKTLDDNICSIGFQTSRFSTNNGFKISVNLDLISEIKSKIFAQILLREENEFILNPDTNAINFKISQEFIASELSFQICSNIHCFVFLSEDQSRMISKINSINSRINSLSFYEDNNSLKEFYSNNIENDKIEIKIFPHKSYFLYFLNFKGFIYPLKISTKPSKLNREYIRISDQNKEKITIFSFKLNLEKQIAKRQYEEPEIKSSGLKLTKKICSFIYTFLNLYTLLFLCLMIIVFNLLRICFSRLRRFKNYYLLS